MAFHGFRGGGRLLPGLDRSDCRVISVTGGTDRFSRPIAGSFATEQPICSLSLLDSARLVPAAMTGVPPIDVMPQLPTKVQASWQVVRQTTFPVVLQVPSYATRQIMATPRLVSRRLGYPTAPSADTPRATSKRRTCGADTRAEAEQSALRELGAFLPHPRLFGGDLRRRPPHSGASSPHRRDRRRTHVRRTSPPDTVPAHIAVLRLHDGVSGGRACTQQVLAPNVPRARQAPRPIGD